MWWEEWLMAKPPGCLGKQPGLFPQPRQSSQAGDRGGPLRPRKGQDTWLLAAASPQPA